MKGVVECQKCLKKDNVDLKACMVEGWPECHESTMALKGRFPDSILFRLLGSGAQLAQEKKTLKKKILHVSPHLSFPVDAVTKTFGIVAVKGVGKTFTAKVMAEEMMEAGHRFIAIDPLGAWWGLRVNKEGDNIEYPVVVIGGKHCDMSLEVNKGEKYADVIMDSDKSFIFDTSAHRKVDQGKFVADLLSALNRFNEDPLHVFIDEADLFAPQSPKWRYQEYSMDAMEDLVRRGRIKGLGSTLITQRCAVISKDVLTQAETLIALRTTAHYDFKVIGEWVRYNQGGEKHREMLMETISTLPIGVAWVWSPGWLQCFKKVKIRPLRSYDSSKTPTGYSSHPVQFVPLDVSELSDKLATLSQESVEDDPVVLRARIKELEEKIKKQNEWWNLP